MRAHAMLTLVLSVTVFTGAAVAQALPPTLLGVGSGMPVPDAGVAHPGPGMPVPGPGMPVPRAGIPPVPSESETAISKIVAAAIAIECQGVADRELAAARRRGCKQGIKLKMALQIPLTPWEAQVRTALFTRAELSPLRDGLPFRTNRIQERIEEIAGAVARVPPAAGE